MSEFEIKCLDWLLKSDNPSIRYRVKRDLLGEAVSAEEQRAVTAGGSPVACILDALKEGQYWVAPRSVYSPKYIASHWSLLILYEMAAPPDLPQVQQAVRFVLENTRRWLDKDATTAEHDHKMACYYGNVLRYAVYFGFADDPTIGDCISYLSRPKHGREWCCVHNLNMPCSWGAIRTLWGLAGLPESLHTEAVQHTISSAVDIIINSCEMLQTIDAAPTIKRHALWEKISFPLYYQCDRLFTLRVLTDAGQLHHPQLKPALQWLAARQTKEGIWRGSHPYRSRSWPFGLEREDIDRWVTLQSLLLLRAATPYHAL